MGTYPDQIQPTDSTPSNSTPENYADYLAWKKSQQIAPLPAQADAPEAAVQSAPVNVKPSVDKLMHDDTYVQSLLSTIEDLKNPDSGVKPPPGKTTAEELASMQAAMEQMKAEFEAKLAAASSQNNAQTLQNESGPPVPHHLHLDDGTVIQNFEGIATHIAQADGTIRRVIAHFPSKLFDVMKDV